MAAGTPSLLLAIGAALSFIYVLLHPPNAAFVAGGKLGGTQVVGDGFPKRLIDPLGREHLLEAPPRRIASVILAGDEMLANLVPAQRVVGVTFLVDKAGISNVVGHYPEAIPRLRAEIEAILALRPDLVLVSTHSDALGVRLLLGAGVAVARFAAFDSFAEVAGNLHILGEILGEEERARAVVEDMERRLSAVRIQVAALPRPRVLYYSLSGSTGGPGTLTDEMIQLAGGYNVIRDTGIIGYRRITPELAISLQPDFVVLNDWSGAGGTSVAELLRNDPAWQQVPAIRDGNVHALRGAWMTSGSQFRVAGVEALARLFHPEAFDAGSP
jgi:iron complex transport system substrate-binding protein